MELKQLAMFLSVAETLNFSRAAEKQFISQSALSYQISSLEQELGVRLFVRDTRSVFLTAEGKHLFSFAKKILGAVDEFSDAAKICATQYIKSPQIRIALDSTVRDFDFFWISEVVSQYMNDYPHTIVDVCATTPDTYVSDLTGNKLDLAFIQLYGNDKPDPALNYIVTREDRIVLAFAHDESVTDFAEVLAKYDLLLPDTKAVFNSKLLKALQNIGIRPNVRTVDTVAVSFVLMKAGLGCLPYPKTYLAQRMLQNVVSVPVLSEDLAVRNMTVWDKTTNNPSVERFKKYIQKKLYTKVYT